MTDMPLMQIDIIQPGDLSPRVFDFWMNVELPDQTSSSMHRLGAIETGDWRIRFHVRNELGLDGPRFAAKFLGDLADQASLFNVANDVRIKTQDLVIDDVPNDDWLAACYQEFAPFEIGGFYLYGSHEKNVGVPEDKIGILIDAVTAFGSGKHPTTRGCLLALEVLERDGLKPTRILDLGTGSGILAIAAKKLWPSAAIVAVDNDPEAVKVAAEYADANQVQYVSLYADTPAAPDVAGAGPYDLVLANILAGPLRELAPAIADVSAESTYAVLSGLLEVQMDEVIAAYTPHGYTVTQRYTDADWAALTLKR